MKTYVIGLDYGTDSVRAILVDTKNGEELAAAVYDYPRWKKQAYCQASQQQFRQHPLDHIEGMEHTIKAVVEKSQVPVERIKSICIDTTGSSPVPLNREGIPLAMVPGFEDNPNAMMVLWKDHTSILEAEEINTLAAHWGGGRLYQIRRRDLFFRMVLGKNITRRPRRCGSQKRGVYLDGTL